MASPPVPLGEILEGDVLNIVTAKLHHTEVHVGKEESVNWGWIWDGDTSNLHKLKIIKIKITQLKTTYMTSYVQYVFMTP